MTSALLMFVGSIIGLFGLVYVVLRHVVANDARKGGWPLLYSFIVAPLFVAFCLNAIGKAVKSDLRAEMWAAATLPILSIAFFFAWLVKTIKKRNEKK